MLTLKHMRIAQIIFAILLLILNNGCRPALRVPEGSYLLHKNKIKTKNIFLDKEELSLVVKQRPNRKILKRYPFYLHVYNQGRHFKDSSKWRTKIEESMGEAPVLIDTSTVQKSSELLEGYLKNKGYYEVKVSDTTILNNKKAIVEFEVNSGKLYKINTYNYNIEDTLLRYFVLKEAYKSVIVYDSPFEIGALENERLRVTQLLRNNGFYYFNKEYIEFSADTSLGRVNLTLRIKPEYEVNTEFLPEGVRIYKQYLIHDVFIDMDYDHRIGTKINKSKIQEMGYYFSYNGFMQYKPSIIIRSLFFQQGDYFNENNINDSYQALAELKLFKFTNIYFTPNLVDSAYGNYLDCHVQLSPIIYKSYTINSEGTNSAGSIGINGNFVYADKNIFKEAQIFQVSLHGGIAAQRLLVDSVGPVINLPGNLENTKVLQNSFNSFEFSPQVTYEIPKIWPLRTNTLPKKSKPHTIFTAQYLYQIRPDFTRNSLNISLAYSAKPFKAKALRNVKTLLYLPDLSYMSYAKDPVFFSKIYKDLKGNNAFSDVFIASIKGSVIYNNQDVSIPLKNFSFVRVDLEQSGTLLQYLCSNNYIKAKQDGDGRYYFFKDKFGSVKPYSQFLKFDVDYRYYQIITKSRSIAYRLFSGIGLPMANSDSVMPFQKSYFAGGNSDIRAWSARGIGPGAFYSDDFFRMIGDLKLEGNAEFRFTILRNWKAALFTDAGNIWLVHKDTSRVGGEFNFKTFHKQVAIGAGIGLRYDFEFFVVRLDFGIPVRDPMLKEGEQWVINNWFDKEWKKEYKNTFNRKSIFAPNIGVGYPF